MASPQLAIRLPPDVRARIEDDAKRQGSSLSAWVKEACMMRLDPPLQTITVEPDADLVPAPDGSRVLVAPDPADEQPDAEQPERPTVTADSMPSRERPLPPGLEEMRVAFGWAKSQIDAMSIDELLKVHDAWVDAGSRVEAGTRAAPAEPKDCPHKIVIRNVCADCGERAE